jgi:hypothetical protein
MVKVIDNFLPKEVFEPIQGFFINKNCPWYLIDSITNDIQDEKYYYMVHNVYDEYTPSSDAFSLLNQFVMQSLKPISILRIKANMYPNQGTTLHKHLSHIDYNFKHKAAILSLNTCDGGTHIGDKFVKSQENRIVIFDGSIPHSSTTCTDKQYRVNIGINYIDEDCITK